MTSDVHKADAETCPRTLPDELLVDGEPLAPRRFSDDAGNTIGSEWIYRRSRASASGLFPGVLHGQVYFFALPVTTPGALSVPGPYLETITSLGIEALYATLVLETLIPAVITYY